MKKSKENSAGSDARKLRYAVVGLGYFSQAAILPAFQHAQENSELAALVSDDPEKRAKLSKKYGVERTCAYSDYDGLLASGDIDAVYIALPNDMHKDFAVRAAKAGIHVLVEKPMAVSEQECQEMMRACDEHHVRMMVAYRLHLEAANLRAINVIEAGKIGEPRFFNSGFSMQVADENIRVNPEHGGGPLYDLGIYCINAARYLFQDEPYEAVALGARKQGDARFDQVDEMVSAILRFPNDRIATFTCSFGAADTSWYSVTGTKGDVCLDTAYDFSEASNLHVTTEGKTQSKVFNKKDQVAAELIYFSDCVLNDKEPEPSGLEGLADVRIIGALLQSAREGGKPVSIAPVEKRARPAKDMEINKPPVSKPDLFHAQAPTSGQ